MCGTLVDDVDFLHFAQIEGKLGLLIDKQTRRRINMNAVTETGRKDVEDVVVHMQGY